MLCVTPKRPEISSSKYNIIYKLTFKKAQLGNAKHWVGRNPRMMEDGQTGAHATKEEKQAVA